MRCESERIMGNVFYLESWPTSSEGKEDEIDIETCSESCQDSDGEFPGCRGGVEDIFMSLLNFCCEHVSEQT